MSMDHKAYAFDYDRFQTELRPVLEAALVSSDAAQLREFVVRNIASLRSPLTEQPLEAGWEDGLETGDVQEIGDLALTKFYDLDANLGLGADWTEIDELLIKQLGKSRGRLTLGDPCGPAHARFDPGSMGSYFQSPQQVRDSLNVFDKLLDRKPDLCDELEDADLDTIREMLAPAADKDLGLYVTF